MAQIWEGALAAKGFTFGIVVSRFNEFISLVNKDHRPNKLPPGLLGIP